MDLKVIDVGTAPNTGKGTPLRTAFGWINDNFQAVAQAVASLLTVSALTDATSAFKALNTDAAGQRQAMGAASVADLTDVELGLSAKLDKTGDPSSLVLPALFTGGAPAVISDVFSEFISGKKFGLLGNNTDETAKLNNALAQASGTGKKLRLTAGYYGVNPSDVDRCLTVPGGISIEAEGRERVTISPLSGVTTAHSLLKIAPMTATNLEFIDIEGLFFYPGANGSKRGGKAFEIDTTLITGGLNLAFLNMRRCYFGPGNDYSVWIKNDITKQAQGAPSNSLFEGCIFYDGFYVRGGGDSNKWNNCAFRSSSAARNMIDLALIDNGGGSNGASVSIFDQCNVGDLGGIVIRAGRRIEFRGLNAELGNLPGSTGGPNNALIEILGDIARVHGVSIIGGLAAIFGSTTATRLIRVDNAQDVDIDGVELSNGTGTVLPAAIEITANATDTHVGRISSLNAAQFTNLVNDAGTGTCGVTQTPASLGTGWSNLGSGYAGASYRKEKYGRVNLNGVLTGSSITNSGSGVPIFTLPTGFRPAQNERRFAAATIGGSQTFAAVDILTNGVVTYQGSSNVTQLQLGGIGFQTNSFHTST